MKTPPNIQNDNVNEHAFRQLNDSRALMINADRIIRIWSVNTIETSQFSVFVKN